MRSAGAACTQCCARAQWAEPAPCPGGFLGSGWAPESGSLEGWKAAVGPFPDDESAPCRTWLCLRLGPPSATCTPLLGIPPLVGPVHPPSPQPLHQLQPPSDLPRSARVWWLRPGGPEPASKASAAWGPPGGSRTESATGISSVPLVLLALPPLPRALLSAPCVCASGGPSLFQARLPAVPAISSQQRFVPTADFSQARSRSELPASRRFRGQRQQGRDGIKFCGRVAGPVSLVSRREPQQGRCLARGLVRAPK